MSWLSLECWNSQTAGFSHLQSSGVFFVLFCSCFRCVGLCKCPVNITGDCFGVKVACGRGVRMVGDKKGV